MCIYIYIYIYMPELQGVVGDLGPAARPPVRGQVRLQTVIVLVN